MAIKLKQSTASQEIPLGYFVDITDGNTEETGLTPANTDLKIWKNGATTLANKNSGGATHISNGIYYAVLDATDTDTLGPLIVFCHISATALPVRVECEVMTAAAWAAYFGDTQAEETAVPASTASLVTKMNFMFPFFRNKMTQTSTTILLRNDADNATIATSTVSDNGTTYTRGEFA